MTILNPTQERALVFTRAANYGGCNPTPSEVIEEKDPDETLIEQLLRFNWIRFNATGVGIMLTDLGRALLRADADETDDDVVFINGNDPLAWGSLVGKIADIGDCLIVDPYLKPDQYLDIAKFTGVTRVILKRPDKPQKLVTWQVNHRLAGESVDIRIAEQHQMHDRFIVGDFHRWRQRGLHARLLVGRRRTEADYPQCPQGPCRRSDPASRRRVVELGRIGRSDQPGARRGRRRRGISATSSRTR